MSDLILTDSQQKVFEELESGLRTIDKMLSASVHHDDGSSLMEALADRVSYLSYTSRLVRIAETMHSWAQGRICENIRNDTSFLTAKEVVLKMYIRGEMARYDGIYEETKKSIRNLEISIESLRTMISYIGKQVNSNIVQK